MKKTDDIVIDQIREGRVRISEQCGNDPARIIEYLKAFNKKYSVEVARYRRLRPRRAVA